VTNDPVVIVGGGITGLAAAHELHRQGRDFVVLDAADRVGGKIAGGPIEGSGLPFDVDMAADGFLAREPEMTELCIELGLEADLTSPRPGGAFMWVDGALRRIPPGVLGAPLDPDAVAGSAIVSPAGVDALRAGLAADLPPLEGDATVGEVLRPRVGDEVFSRLVDPLIGGINAGTADEMSIRSGAAALASAAAKGGPFGKALRDHVATAVTGGPVFHAVRGGSQRIIDALSDELGDRIRTGAEVFDVARNGDDWIVRTDDEAFSTSNVVLTTPGWVSAGLLAPHAPEAAAVLAGLAYADAILVTFVAHRSQIAHDLDGAGFLVPRDQGLLMTACSVSSYKWEHFDDGEHVVMRVSAGRTDDGRWLEMPTDAVVDRLLDELRLTVGLTGDAVARVSEWRRCLPQYRPGHLERCTQIDEWLRRDAPGIRVAGASMRGLGLPACVRQGRAAAIAST
jgi:oxygen-dependent protoporphyrinogen oxidase